MSGYGLTYISTMWYPNFTASKFGTIFIFMQNTKWQNREAPSFTMKDTTIDVHFAHANPWLFTIPITKPLLDFVHLLLKCGSSFEATHLSLDNLKIMNQQLPKITIVNYIFFNTFQGETIINYIYIVNIHIEQTRPNIARTSNIQV